MLSYDFKQAISCVSRELNQQNLAYALIGSANLALQGMDLSPKDLDLVMQINDLKKAPKIFKKYHASPVEELRSDSNDPAWTAKLKNHPAWDVHFNIEKIPVQILGEPQNGEYVSKLISKKLVYILVSGVNIPCFTLEAEAYVHKETFRFEKAERIVSFLKTRKA